MTDDRVDTHMRWRAIKACAVVLAFMCIVPGVEAMLRVVGAPDEPSWADAGIEAGLLVGSGDPLDVVAQVEAYASAGQGDILPAFEDEIGFLADARDIRINDDGSIVGYVVDGDEDEALCRLTAHMQGRGWSCVPLGEVAGATFVKRDGSCTWALATCSQVGAATSVVMRCVIQ